MKGTRIGFRPRQRERAWWLVAAAACAAGLWAIAQVLQLPIALRATLAALAAVVALLVPELRSRAGRADLNDRLLRRVEVSGVNGALPRAKEVGLDRLGVHAAQVTVPYISRDSEEELDSVLKAREPVLVVGHSMAGKTRLAADRVQTLFPDAPLLAPPSGKVLRQLVDAGLKMGGVVVWLDDLERFIRGEDALDSGLLDRLIAARAIVVSTIRRNELEPYLSRNQKRPPEWGLLARFRQIPLQRLLTTPESQRVADAVSDRRVLAAVQRYGLAEYVGGGPDAVRRLDNGETVCPVGYALVRAAVDWRRAGLARLVPLPVLQAALPAYLEGRVDVARDAGAIEHALSWATNKINETVALLLPHHTTEAGPEGDRLFEAFDYLVDIVAERHVHIPAMMWRLVAEAASAVEAVDVARAVEWQFVGRSRVVGELAAWLTAPPIAEIPRLLVLAGGPGTGKSALLAHLTTLVDPAMQQLVRKDDSRPRLSLPSGSIDVVIHARGKIASRVLLEIADGAGVKKWGASDMDSLPDLELANALMDALRGRVRPLIILLDGLDEALLPEAEQIARLLAHICLRADEPGLRLVVGTRRDPRLLAALRGARIIDLDSPEYSGLDDPALFAKKYLMNRKGSPYRDRPELAEAAAAEITHRGSIFLFVELMCESLVEHAEPWDPMSEEPLPFSLDDQLSKRLSRLGAERQRAEDLLAALAFSPGHLAPDLWLEEANRLGRRHYTLADLNWLLASPAGSFIATSAEAPPMYHLFHVAIRDHIADLWRAGRERID